MIVIGIDQSKRSTAAVALKDGTLVGGLLVTPPISYDKEILIDYQWEEISKFLRDMKETFNREDIAIALEGAAFQAGGSSSDLLWGIQWYIRTRILVEFPNIPIGIITPASWRKSIVPIEEQRKAKLDYGGKIGLKHAVLEKLPLSVRGMFEELIENRRDNILISKGLQPSGRSNEYKKAIFDLADAWGIAKHRYLLEGKPVKVPKTPDKKMSTLQRRFPSASKS